VIVMGYVEGRSAAGPFRRACVWTWKLAGGRVVHVRVADMGDASS
jgi:hypothetical protein